MNVNPPEDSKNLGSKKDDEIKYTDMNGYEDDELSELYSDTEDSIDDILGNLYPNSDSKEEIEEELFGLLNKYD